MYLQKFSADIIKLCISYIQDSHPITETRKYWIHITENGYKNKFKKIRPSMLEYLLILDSFDNYIGYNENNRDRINDMEVFNNFLYLPEIEHSFFENYFHQQSYIDKCLIITSYLKGCQLDYQLRFLFDRVLTIRSFPNFNILTIPFLKYTREHMRHFPFVNDRTKLTETIRNYQFNSIIQPYLNYHRENENENENSNL